MESMNVAEKTLIHISHLHPLKLAASPEPKPICPACNMPCGGLSYGCVDCYYFLHITCATSGRSMNHPSHPFHTLNLELTVPYPNGQYGCDACGVNGSSFCLRCRECTFDLHLHCAAVPHQVHLSSHHHPLTLVYSNPYPANMEYSCDLCKKYLDVNKWFYLCSSCNFGGHVGCFLNISAERPEVLSPGLQQSQRPEMLSPGLQQSQLPQQTVAELQRQMMYTQITSQMEQRTLRNILSSMDPVCPYCKR